MASFFETFETYVVFEEGYFRRAVFVKSMHELCESILIYYAEKMFVGKYGYLRKTKNCFLR